MKGMNKQIFITLCIIFVLSIGSCKCGKQKFKPVTREFNSLEALAKYYIKLINEGDFVTAGRSFMTRKTYIEQIHDFTDYGSRKDKMSGADHYRIFLQHRRLYGLKRMIKKYKDKIIEFKKLGKPKNVFDYKKFRFLRKIPVTMLVQDKGNSIIKDENRILGLVIERNKKYSLLTMFR